MEADTRNKSRVSVDRVEELFSITDTTYDLCIRRAIPATATDSSPRREQHTVKRLRPCAPLLWECSLPSWRVADAVRLELSVETLEPDQFVAGLQT